MTTVCNRLQFVHKLFPVTSICTRGNADHRCKLLVLGGGAGGCSTAAKFANKLGKGFVIVVDPSDVHYYQPMFTLVGGGIKKVKDSQRSMSSVLPKNAKWFKDSVAKIHPKDNFVTTASGIKISYEYLVVALGIEMHFEKVKGLEDALNDPKSGASSNYSPLYAEKTFENLSRLKSGNAVFSFPNTPVKCAGAPLKACFLSEHYIRKAGHRKDVNFFYRTSLPVIFSVQHYAKELLKLSAARGIDVGVRKELVEVNALSHEAKFKNIDNPLEVETIECYSKLHIGGEIDDREEHQVEKMVRARSPERALTISSTSYCIQYSMLHAVPPMAPPAVLAKSSPDLVDQAGYLKVNKNTLAHETFPNIFGIGDCTNLPTSKTAAAVAGQVGVLYENLNTVMEGKESLAKYDGYTSCPLVTGYGSCIMAEFDYDLQPLETFPSWFNQSREHLSMYLMKKDVMPALYWHGMMKA